MMLRRVKPSEDSYPTRPSLLRRVQAGGDEEGWREFNDQSGLLIFRFAVKAGLNEAEAPDVVQETMIAATRNLPEFRYDPKVCSFKTWLLTLSRWRGVDQLRKRLPQTPAPRATRRARSRWLWRRPARSGRADCLPCGCRGRSRASASRSGRQWLP
jgi:DNA-directed RNA polymerase specialized sigma24 family protein